MAAQDVKTGPDTMDHDFLFHALMRPGYAGILARDLTNVQGGMRIDGAEPSLPFDFQRGGKQGGIETPDCFNIYLEEAIGGVISAWDNGGLGFKLDSFRVTHAVWADNIIVFAADKAQLFKMIEELGHAVAAAISLASPSPGI